MSDNVKAADDAERVGCVGSMTPERAIYFLERFKRDEKMLGPHEQWALDYAITALTPTPPTDVAGLVEVLWDKRKIAEAMALHLEPNRDLTLNPLYYGDPSWGVAHAVQEFFRAALAQAQVS